MQNKGAEVSIAIPKAQQPKKFERVSPGVYRGPKGELKRSASNPGSMSKPSAPQSFMPGNPSLADIAGSMTQKPSRPGPANSDELLRYVRELMAGNNNPLLENPSMNPIPKMPMTPVTADISIPEGMRPNLSDLLKGMNGPQIPRSGSISDLLRGR